VDLDVTGTMTGAEISMTEEVVVVVVVVEEVGVIDVIAMLSAVGDAKNASAVPRLQSRSESRLLTSQMSFPSFSASAA
jgi:hypothetical protein